MKDPYKIDDPIDRIKFAREAAHVHRVHATAAPLPYYVGMHQHNMLSMLRILYPDAGTCLIWAIHEHDLPERLTSDMSHPAKAMGLLNKDRQAAIEAFLNTQVFGIESQPLLTPEEHEWLHGLDMLEFYCWCKDQIMLGNRTVETQMRYVEKFIPRHAANYPREIVDTYYAIKDHDWQTMPDMEDHG